MRTLTISLLAIVLSLVSIFNAYGAYKRMKQSEKTLCFMIFDRFGEDDRDEDCQQYKQEWKELQ